MRLNPFQSAPSAPPEDFGFGEQLATPGIRLVDKSGEFMVDRRGGDRLAYQWLIQMPWPRFFAAVLAYYIVVNLLFGGLYVLLGMEGITGDHGPTLGTQLSAGFFFSVQTLTTVGYGLMAPMELPHQLLAAFEALVGLLSLALATGLLFARFSKPRDLFRFSTGAVVAPYRDGSALMVRLANRSSTKLIRVSADVLFSWIEPDEHGGRRRRFHTLALERNEIAMFPLNWTIVHPITPDSPLADRDAAWLATHDTEIVVQVRGFAETYAREVYAHSSYLAACIAWGARFAAMHEPGADGRTILYLDRISATEPVPLHARGRADASGAAPASDLTESTAHVKPAPRPGVQAS